MSGQIPDREHERISGVIVDHIELILSDPDGRESTTETAALMDELEPILWSIMGRPGYVISGEPGMEVGRTTIVRTMTQDDVVDVVEAVTPEGDDLPLTEALGMLRLAEHTLIFERTGGTP